MLGGIAASPAPPLTLSESQSVLPWCAHWQSSLPLYSLPLSRLSAFVLSYTSHNVHLSVLLLLSCYYVADNLIPTLSGCVIVPRVTPSSSSPPSSPRFVLTVRGAGSCVMESDSAIYCPCLSFWGLIWWGIKQLTHICYTHAWSVTSLTHVSQKKKKDSRSVCSSARLILSESSCKRLSGYLSRYVSVCDSAHTPITWSCPDTSFEPKLLVTSQA